MNIIYNVNRPCFSSSTNAMKKASIKERDVFLNGNHFSIKLLIFNFMGDICMYKLKFFDEL